MKVLIVEDDPLHRTYLHEAVVAALPECDTVIEAENGLAGEKLARDHKSAHIVMDLQMATRNGIEAARHDLEGAARDPHPVLVELLGRGLCPRCLAHRSRRRRLWLCAQVRLR